MTTLKLGQQTKNGIYIGQYESKSLGNIFNVYAAPQNVGRNPQAYTLKREQLAKLKNWHGFDGTNYASHKETEQALKDGSYTGGWIIPPMEILNNNLVHIKEALMKVDAHNDIYWSSTEETVYKGMFYTRRLWDGYAGYEPTYAASHCRPVRLVAVK